MQVHDLEFKGMVAQITRALQPTISAQVSTEIANASTGILAQAASASAGGGGSIIVGGQDPAAVARVADEGSAQEAARADHVHPLNLEGDGTFTSISGDTTAFIVNWLGIKLGSLGLATELDFSSDFSVTVDHDTKVATISYAGSTGTQYGPPTSGTKGLDLAGAIYDKSTGSWVQRQPGVCTNFGGGGATDITDSANWTGGSFAESYRVIEPDAGLWEYHAASGWTDLAEQQVPMQPAAMPPFSAARAKASLLPLPGGFNWLIEEADGMAAGSVGVWDAFHRWDISLCQNGTTLGTVQQTTQAEAFHSMTIGQVIDGGLVLALKATPVGRPGLLTELGETVRMRRVRAL